MRLVQWKRVFVPEIVILPRGLAIVAEILIGFPTHKVWHTRLCGEHMIDLGELRQRLDEMAVYILENTDSNLSSNRGEGANADAES